MGGDTVAVVGVQSADVPEYWGHAEKHLKRIKGLDTDHAGRLCAQARWQLWLLAKGGECVGALTTEVTNEPAPVVYIKNAAFDSMADSAGPAIDEITRWAASLNAPKPRIIGRKGWARALRKYGYGVKAVILEAA